MRHTIKLFVSLSLLALAASAGYAQKEKPLVGDEPLPVGGGFSNGNALTGNKSAGIAGKATVSLAMEERAFLVNGQLVVLGINPTQNKRFGSASVAAPPTPKIETTIYPNPTTGAFSMLLPDGITAFDRVEILDASGRAIADLTHESTLDGNRVRVPGSRLASGSYFVRVDTHSKSVLYKLAVEH